MYSHETNSVFIPIAVLHVHHTPPRSYVKRIGNLAVMSQVIREQPIQAALYPLPPGCEISGPWKIQWSATNGVTPQSLQDIGIFHMRYSQSSVTDSAYSGMLKTLDPDV